MRHDKSAATFSSWVSPYLTNARANMSIAPQPICQFSSERVNGVERRNRKIKDMKQVVSYFFILKTTSLVRWWKYVLKTKVTFFFMHVWWIERSECSKEKGCGVYGFQIFQCITWWMNTNYKPVLGFELGRS